MEKVYKNYEKMKVTSGSGIFENTCHNGSYLLLFGIGKLQGLETPCK